jgi:hypothetical protein
MHSLVLDAAHASVYMQTNNWYATIANQSTMQTQALLKATLQTCGEVANDRHYGTESEARLDEAKMLRSARGHPQATAPTLAQVRPSASMPGGGEQLLRTVCVAVCVGD